MFHSPRPTFEFLRFTLNEDGRLAALTLTNAVQLLDVETGIELVRLPLAGAQAVVFLPAQAGLAATSDRGLFAWSFRPGAVTGEIQIGPRRAIRSGENWTQIRLGPSGRRLAAWQEDCAHIYALPEFREVFQTGNHRGGVPLGPSFSRDERLLAIARWNNSAIAIWDLAASNLLHRIKVTTSRDVTHGRAEFTPDGEWLFVTTLEDMRLYEPGS